MKIQFQFSMPRASVLGTGLERDDFAGRRYVVLPVLVQKDEGPGLSRAGPAGLSVFL